MPVGYIDNSKTAKVKFVRNTCEGGIDYGPDYLDEAVNLPLGTATIYVEQGRAVFVETESGNAIKPKTDKKK